MVFYGFLGQPLTEREKLQMVSFMEESYKKFGGSDLGGYNKGLRQNFKDLQSLQKFSELEMSRNLFNPNKSHFLNGSAYDEQLREDEDYLMTSKLLKGAEENADLSKSITDYVRTQRLRDSRSEALGRKIGDIVSYLQDNDVEAERLHEISQMLLDGNELNDPKGGGKGKDGKKLKGILKNKNRGGKGKRGGKSRSKSKDGKKKSSRSKSKGKKDKGKSRSKSKGKGKSKSKDKVKKGKKDKRSKSKSKDKSKSRDKSKGKGKKGRSGSKGKKTKGAGKKKKKKK